MKKIKFNFENVGGLAEVYAFPPADFLRLRHDYVNDSDSLELRTRDNVIAVPVYATGLLYSLKRKTVLMGETIGM